jgi:hypothetical protein
MLPLNCSHLGIACCHLVTTGAAAPTGVLLLGPKDPQDALRQIDNRHPDDDGHNHIFHCNLLWNASQN